VLSQPICASPASQAALGPKTAERESLVVVQGSFKRAAAAADYVSVGGELGIERRDPGSDPYAGISLRNTRKLAATGWAAGIVIACLLMIPAPPTAQLGGWGWAAGAGVQALSAAGLILFQRYRERVGFGVILVVTWLLPIDVGVMQWLGGGWSAPYHELLLPAAILGSAGLPPRRFVPFAIAVVGIALLPALYAPDRDGLLRMGAELAVWSFVIGTLSALMARLRRQRVAHARLARSDALTGLANRRALHERFERPRPASLVLAIGDLNDFKRINDHHGHVAGDACLTEVGALLAARARQGDQVFRWGGDEFAVLLHATRLAEAARVFARLEAAVATEVRDPDGLPVVITFGWAEGGPDADLLTLTRAADAMLLARKVRPVRSRA
jgi:diguanylate cyclase (GGDEF)-like protein